MLLQKALVKNKNRILKLVSCPLPWRSNIFKNITGSGTYSVMKLFFMVVIFTTKALFTLL